MPKREADTYLTNRGAVDDESDEEPSGPVVADEETLSKRTILKAKTRTTGGGDKKNAFAGFTGFGKSSGASPFAPSGDGKKPTFGADAKKPAFGKLASSATTSKPDSTSDSPFSGGTFSVKKPAPGAKPLFGLPKKEEKSETMDTTPSTSTSGGTWSTKSIADAKALNVSFVEHLKSEIKKPGLVDLTPCFSKYTAHLNDIKKGNSSSSNGASTGAEGAAVDPSKLATVNDTEPVEGEVYGIRGKLFWKNEDKFVERGVGQFRIIDEDNSKSLVMRASSTTGHYLLNVRLLSSMSTKRLGKKDLLFSCVPNPPVQPKCPVCGKAFSSPQTSNECPFGCFGPGGSTFEGKEGEKPKPISYLFRVKTGEMADEVKAKIDEFK